MEVDFKRESAFIADVEGVLDVWDAAMEMHGAEPGLTRRALKPNALWLPSRHRVIRDMNRDFNEHRADAFATDMEEGRWWGGLARASAPG